MGKKKNSLLYQLLVIIAIVIVVNIIAVDYFARLDLTDDNRYTLSDATIDIVQSLEEPVTVTAYFTEDLPPRLRQSGRNFKDLLIEYASYSEGMINYEFIDPADDDEIKQQAAKAGVQPVIVNVREEDQVKQQRAFLGAVIRKGEQKEVLPVITEAESMEYSLSSGIKKLSVKERHLVGFVTGHGEPPLQQMQQTVQALSVLYDVEPVNLEASGELTKYKTLALIAPSDTIPPAHLQKLDDYLASGGNLYVALNRVRGDFSQARGLPVNTGLADWLSGKGVAVGTDFVVDNRSNTVGVTQERGGFNMTTQIKFPYLPVITNFQEHPVTQGLEQVSLRFASSLEYRGDTAVIFTPLAKSSAKSGRKQAPLMFQVQKEWTAADFPDSGIPVAAALKGPIAGSNASKMVVVTDGDFAVGGQGRNARQLNEDNVSLLVNGVDWLSDDTGLIGLRTKGVSSRPIDELEDSTKALLRYGNFLVPILLIIIYGLIRYQYQRSLRVKRMEEGYV